jgi:hypothetical protein
MRHVVAAMFILVAAPALAHEFWLDGEKQPNSNSTT